MASDAMRSKISDTTTANAAPALMPRMPLSASGFRVSACMIAPATASAMPANKPATTRGARTSRMMMCANSAPS